MKRAIRCTMLVCVVAARAGVVGAGEVVQLGGPTPLPPAPQSAVGDLHEDERAAARALLKAMPAARQQAFLKRLRAAAPQARAELLRGLLRAQGEAPAATPAGGP
ncbi:MAG: hypothetical protein H6977_08130 [Gammaproteobacteria bacterium]|nr:hypothetical protein [Gammaproteobacteria bacterium]MCP5199966.1 hypothetical protein [Gammaproteobacteria bacterium]